MERNESRNEDNRKGKKLQRIMLMVFEDIMCKRQRGMKNKIDVHKQNNRYRGLARERKDKARLQCHNGTRCVLDGKDRDSFSDPSTV
jgi:hypothetical protein